MTLSIKAFAYSLVLFLIVSIYTVFSQYYFTQRNSTANVIVSNINNDLSELSYLLSRHVKQEPIQNARALLDRKAANNRYLSAIAVFKNGQLIMTSDPSYSTIPGASDFYATSPDNHFMVLHERRAFIEDIYYYEGKNLKQYLLVFFLDNKSIKHDFTHAKQDFALLFIFLPILFVAVIWFVFRKLVAKPLEILRQYAYYNETIPKAFRIKEIEYIRASMVQTFSRLEQEKKELYNLARTDSLSGLANRDHLQERVEQIIDLSKRDKKEFALLFLDLDHFKSVNDLLGHDIGDELLRHIACTIQKILRTNDVVARIGGDEFIIVLTHYKDKLELYEIIERIQAQLMKPWLIRTYPINISSSIGITIYPNDGGDLLTLMKNADIAMYEAKARGRKGYHFFTEDLNVKTQERIELTNAMREALKNNQYELYYQPQNDVKTGGIVGAEVLIRWNTPNKGFIAPNVFIPIAEHNGFIIELGLWILETGIKQLKKWEDSNIDLKLSINVAAEQILHKDFVSNLSTILATHKVQASSVFLEITEYVFLNDSDLVHKTFRQIKALGVQISLDDFGTGYSSLSYLKNFPIDILKIDKMFIDDYDKEDGAIFIETIINMAQTLKIKVLAEGVESQDQVRYLKSLNCERICVQPTR